MKVSEALKLLKPIAENYKLNLSRHNEFKIAKMLLANLYCHDFYECRDTKDR